MKQRHVLYWGLLLTVATLLAIFVFDGLVASALTNAVPSMGAIVDALVHAVEILFLFPLSKFASGAVVVVAAIVLFILPGRRATARLVLFVGLTQLTARLVAGVLKNTFGRLRPFEAFAGGQWDDRFFVEGGNSFPSGHGAHFWGFFFALAIAFPRYRVPFLILAVAVSLARVVVNDHYVSDLLASAAISAFVAYGYAAVLILRARLQQGESPAEVAVA